MYLQQRLKQPSGLVLTRLRLLLFFVCSTTEEVSSISNVGGVGQVAERLPIAISSISSANI
jgi:hypothetical protein